MELESDYEPETSTPDSLSSDIGPQFMEYRPNSRSENPTRLPLQSLTQHSVLEHYVLTRASDHCVGPKYVTYNAKSSRIQSFVSHDRPHMLDLLPDALSVAGFFFTGKFLKIF